MVLNEIDSRKEQVLSVAQAMMTAARTAPKAKGVDRLEIVTVTGDDLRTLAEHMRVLSERNGFKFYLRDANNVEQADAIVIIGTHTGVFNLSCGFCGFPTCDQKLLHPAVPCAFNMGDLGIAVGSAVSIAADHRVDSRVMYSAAHGAMSRGLIPECHAAFAILLSSTGKSPFFDRVAPSDTRN